MLLEDRTRALLWTRLTEAVEHYLAGVHTARVAPVLDVGGLRSMLAAYTFEAGQDPLAVVEAVVEGLWQHQVHTPHPHYFGLFNPAPTTMGIAADLLVAAFNPQMAAWSHSPLAAEIERHLVRAFGERFGYDPVRTDGTFTSGGAEANHTALLTALTHVFPTFTLRGVRSLRGQPVFYVSQQSHHSFLKAARFCGLGTEAVVEVPVNARFEMRLSALEALLEEDRQQGRLPFMVVATAGTTSGGQIDPLPALADLAAAEGLWLHVDAAWGGAAALVPELRPLMEGIHRADSITFDAHKFLSVPMGAGLYLTRHPDILARTCGIATSYMPRDAAGLDVVDPFTHSMQWSRRFTGLKVFLSLAVAGWDGYAAAIRHQTAMGALLRDELRAHGWRVVNDTPLPVVCFVDARTPADLTGVTDGAQAAWLEAVAQAVVASGEAWISTTKLDPNTPVLRACITNYRTTEADVRALVHLLDRVRAAAGPPV